jgi:hypothetical protein
MSIENLYQQAQVFLDASSEGRPLRVNATGQLKAAGLASRAVTSVKRLLSTDSARQAQAIQHNRHIVKALIQAVEDAMAPASTNASSELSHAVVLLNSSYEAGELPAAQAFVSLLRQVEHKKNE